MTVLQKELRKTSAERGRRGETGEGKKEKTRPAIRKRGRPREKHRFCYRESACRALEGKTKGPSPCAAPSSSARVLRKTRKTKKGPADERKKKKKNFLQAHLKKSPCITDSNNCKKKPPEKKKRVRELLGKAPSPSKMIKGEKRPKTLSRLKRTKRGDPPREESASSPKRQLPHVHAESERRREPWRTQLAWWEEVIVHQTSERKDFLPPAPYIASTQ